MLTAEARRRLAVVLVGARNPQNIGAAARAMQDLGFSDLRVVNGFAPPFEAAQLEANQLEPRSAVGAGEVMRSARLFSSLAEAIADCTLITGTTAIGGRGLRLPVQSLRDAAMEILASLNASQPSAPPRPAAIPATAGPSAQTSNGEVPVEQNAESQPHSGQNTPARVALLFGSEKTGLTNDQLSHCSLLLTIPLFAPAGRHLSLNLGQAVAVCLYELTREGLEGSRALPVLSHRAASSGDRERLVSLLTQAMAASGYAHRFPANARPEVIRQLAGSLATTREEAATWMGLFKHLGRPTTPDS